jgi:hypothetical protein
VLVSQVENTTSLMTSLQATFQNSLNDNLLNREELVIKKEHDLLEFQKSLATGNLELEKERQRLSSKSKEVDDLKATLCFEIESLKAEKLSHVSLKESEIFKLKNDRLYFENSKTEYLSEKRELIKEINLERKEVSLLKIDLQTQKRELTCMQQELTNKNGKLTDKIDLGILLTNFEKLCFDQERDEFWARKNDFLKEAAEFDIEKMKLECLYKELAVGSDVFRNRQSELQKTVHILHKLKSRPFNESIEADCTSNRKKRHPKISKRVTVELDVILESTNRGTVKGDNCLEENHQYKSRNEAKQSPRNEVTTPKEQQWSIEDLDEARSLEAQVDSYVARYQHVNITNLDV